MTGLATSRSELRWMAICPETQSAAHSRSCPGPGYTLESPPTSQSLSKDENLVLRLMWLFPASTLLLELKFWALCKSTDWKIAAQFFEQHNATTFFIKESCFFSVLSTGVIKRVICQLVPLGLVEISQKDLMPVVIPPLHLRSVFFH